MLRRLVPHSMLTWFALVLATGIALSLITVSAFHTFNRDVPHRAYFGQYWHGPATGPSGESFAQLGMDWFDRYVNGTTLADQRNVLVQEPDGRWRAENDWPPTDARGESLRLIPGTYQATLGNNEETDGPLGGPQMPTGKGIWTFTPPLTHSVRIAGNPTLSVRVTATGPASEVIPLVYDVDEASNATFVDRGAYQVDAGTSNLSFDLYPQDWTFAAGHRIAVLLTGDDDYWFEPRGQAPVSILSGSVTFPVLGCGHQDYVSDNTPNFVPRSAPTFDATPALTSSATTDPFATKPC